MSETRSLTGSRLAPKGVFGGGGGGGRGGGGVRGGGADGAGGGGAWEGEARCAGGKSWWCVGGRSCWCAAATLDAERERDSVKPEAAERIFCRSKESASRACTHSLLKLTTQLIKGVREPHLHALLSEVEELSGPPRAAAR